MYTQCALKLITIAIFSSILWAQSTDEKLIAQCQRILKAKIATENMAKNRDYRALVATGDYYERLLSLANRSSPWSGIAFTTLQRIPLSEKHIVKSLFGKDKKLRELVLEVIIAHENTRLLDMDNFAKIAASLENIQGTVDFNQTILDIFPPMAIDSFAEKKRVLQFMLNACADNYAMEIKQQLIQLLSMRQLPDLLPVLERKLRTRNKDRDLSLMAAIEAYLVSQYQNARARELLTAQLPYTYKRLRRVLRKIERKKLSQTALHELQYTSIVEQNILMTLFKVVAQLYPQNAILGKYIFRAFSLCEYIFAVDKKYAADLNNARLSDELRQVFAKNNYYLSEKNVFRKPKHNQWLLDDSLNANKYLIKIRPKQLAVYKINPQLQKAALKALLALDTRMLRAKFTGKSKKFFLDYLTEEPQSATWQKVASKARQFFKNPHLKTKEDWREFREKQ